jgi:hypothetical protein
MDKRVRDEEWTQNNDGTKVDFGAAISFSFVGNFDERETDGSEDGENLRRVSRPPVPRGRAVHRPNQF